MELTFEVRFAYAAAVATVPNLLVRLIGVDGWVHGCAFACT